MDFRFDADPDPLLGLPTVNVGMINGGMNINSVPDHAEFTIDFRTTTKVDHSKILEKLTGEIGNETEIETLVDLKPVFTPEDVPFVKLVYKVCGIEKPSSRISAGTPISDRRSSTPEILQGCTDYYSRAGITRNGTPD